MSTLHSLNDTTWTPVHIKDALKDRGWSMARVGRMAGVTRGAVRISIGLDDSNPRYVGHKIRGVIAGVLGVPIKTIWPEPPTASAS